MEATKESKTAKERMTESSLVGGRELEGYLKGFVKILVTKSSVFCEGKRLRENTYERQDI